MVMMIMLVGFSVKLDAGEDPLLLLLSFLFYFYCHIGRF